MAKTDPLPPRATRYQVLRLWQEKTKFGYSADYSEQEWFENLDAARRTFQQWRARFGLNANLELMEFPPDQASRSLLTDGLSYDERLGSPAAAVRQVAEQTRMPEEGT